MMYYIAERHPEANLYPNADRQQIDEYVELFYKNFAFIGGFTFGNFLRWGPCIALFIIKGKCFVMSQKMRRLEAMPEFQDAVANKKAAMEALKADATKPMS